MLSGGRGFGALHQLLCDGVELGGLGALGAGKGNGQAAIAAFADGGDEFDGTEKGNVELRRGALGAALGEDVDLVMAMRAGEVAHVFDDAEDFDVDLGEHLEGLAGVLQADVAGRGDDDGAGERHGLHQGDDHVAGAGRADRR